jgi:hypothetical protein
MAVNADGGAAASSTLRGGNIVPETVRINATRERVDKRPVPAGGRSQLEAGERITRLAQRIWEAFARDRWTMAKVALPPWEAVDERQRMDIISLAADALGPAK